MSTDIPEYEKERLYEAYQEEIDDIENCFENIIDRIHDQWVNELAKKVPNAEIVEDPDYSEKYEEINQSNTVDVKLEDGSTKKWCFFTWSKRSLENDHAEHNKKYNGLIKKGWIIRNSGEDVFPMDLDSRNGNLNRIQLYHRLNNEGKKEIKQNQNILIHLAQSVTNKRKFQEKFEDKIKDKYYKNKDDYPQFVEINKGNKYDIGKRDSPIRIRYDISLEDHESFSQCYIEALSNAFTDIVINQRRLIDDATTVLNETVDEVDEA